MILSSLKILISPTILTDYVTFEESSVLLNPGEQKTIKVKIKAPKDDSANTHQITFIVKNDKAYAEANLTLNTKPVDTESGTEHLEAYGSLFLGMIALIIILIIMVISLFLLLLIERSKSKKKININENKK